MRACWFALLCLALLGSALVLVDRSAGDTKPATADAQAGAEIEGKLKPLARPFVMTDWQRKYQENGQSFEEYLRAAPVRRSKQLNTVYLCLMGEFTPEQEKVLEAAREYLGVFFDCPVKVRKRIKLSDVPEKARRVHPQWGDKQVLASYVLDEVLAADRPDDALAYLAFTSFDLWPGEGWNFVFGQASLYKRVGVWSIYRNGDPKRDYQLVLRRTLATASHELGHVLTLQHCIAHECNMNGSNHLEESDKKPLHFCPVCARKLIWNLQVDPVAYFQKLEAFCRKHELKDEADYYAKAARALGG